MALQRVESYAAYSRAVLAGYVRLNRSELRARLADHQADCLAVQLELLADPEFRNRAGGVLARDPVAGHPGP
jgi:hypothetical protein